MPMPMLDEMALRKPDFREGIPIKLCDGQTWHLAAPEVQAYFVVAKPKDGGDARIIRGCETGQGDYDRLLDRYLNSEDGPSETIALAELAHNMLARNYDLSFDDCRHLLRVYFPADPRREENESMWELIGNAAMGVTPKPSAVG